MAGEGMPAFGCRQEGSKSNLKYDITYTVILIPYIQFAAGLIANATRSTIEGKTKGIKKCFFIL